MTFGDDLPVQETQDPNALRFNEPHGASHQKEWWQARPVDVSLKSEATYERVLDMMRVAYPLAMSRYEIERDDLTRLAYGQALLRLEAGLLAEKVARSTYVKDAMVTFPRTWWQHFKHTYQDRWWLRRLVRRWPVETQSRTVTLAVEVDRYLRYPEAALQIRDIGRPYIFEVVEVFTSTPDLMTGERDEDREPGATEALSRVPQFCGASTPQGEPCNRMNTLKGHWDGQHSIGALHWPVTVDEMVYWANQAVWDRR